VRWLQEIARDEVLTDGTPPARRRSSSRAPTVGVAMEKLLDAQSR